MEGRPRSDTVDLNDNNNSSSFSSQPLIVEISDALSEREKVQFTVRTRFSLMAADKADVSVVRQHEDFLWLHQVLEENEAYAGYIIPPAPPRPNFDSSRNKLQQLGESESSMTLEEFNKMKAELEAEYLVTFKKTVAMHEIFLKRLAAHPVIRDDSNLHVFLSYAHDLLVRTRNKKERLAGLFSSLSKTADELVLQSTQKDIDDWFETERVFLTKYFDHLKDATGKADRMTQSHKSVADLYIKVSAELSAMVPLEMNSRLETFYPKVADGLERFRKLDSRMSSDADLKLSDILRYYQRDSGAAKSLLYRRLRALADYEAANRNLQKARIKNKDVPGAEAYQKLTCDKFEQISVQAKQELRDFRARRVADFRKSFTDLAELELKHCQASAVLLREMIAKLKTDYLVK